MAKSVDYDSAHGCGQMLARRLAQLGRVVPNLRRVRINLPTNWQVQTFGFLLLPGFALMSFAAAI